MEACIFCPASKTRCTSCATPTCARHLSKQNRCCSTCIADVQESASLGRCTTEEEDEQLKAIGGDQAYVYGELTTLGMRALSDRLRLGTGDCFLDAGSGLGRIVFQAAREMGVVKSIGVELAQSRHDLAVEALGREALVCQEKIELIHGNCIDQMLWRSRLRDVTVVFLASLFYSDELMKGLARCLEEAAPAVRVVATLRRWEEPPTGFAEETPPQACETSWTAPDTIGGDAPTEGDGTTPVHIYVRLQVSSAVMNQSK